MDEPRAARTLRTKELLGTPYFSVRVDRVVMPDAREIDHYVISFAEACSIVAVNEDRQVLLFEQYRYPVGEYLWEIPAGARDGDEALLECAQRELAEESGYRAASWRPLITRYSQLCSVANPVMSIFLATDLEHVPDRRTDVEDIRNIRFVDLEQAYEGARRGEFKNAFTSMGILLAHAALSE